jgi:hypothetical protein
MIHEQIERALKALESIAESLANLTDPVRIISADSAIRKLDEVLKAQQLRVIFERDYQLLVRAADARRSDTEGA